MALPLSESKTKSKCKQTADFAQYLLNAYWLPLSEIAKCKQTQMIRASVPVYGVL
jgi:hypothetical protein